MFPRHFLKMALAGVVLVCFGATGCKTNSGQSDVSEVQESSGQHYTFLFGHRYRTQTDLYVFFFAQNPDYKYVGTRANGLDCGPKELPVEVTQKNIGQTYERWAMDGLGDLVILGVAPAGSILTIRAETHDVTFLSRVRGSGGYPMGFICDLNYDGQTNSVLTEFIQSHKKVSGKVPNEFLNPALVKEIE